MQTTQTSINLHEMPIGTTYICRDGSEVTIEDYQHGDNYPYKGNNLDTYIRSGRVYERDKDPRDIVAVKPAKPSQYETILQIASSIQEAGGSVSHLHKITLEDFLNICQKNNIEIAVKYNKGK